MSRDASLRQRQYRFNERGNSSQGQRQGKYVIKNNMATHFTCKWGDGFTTIRIFPSKNPEDPTGQTWDPFRFSADGNDYGDWMRRYDAIRSFGESGITMIIQQPGEQKVNERRSPPWVLYHAVHEAIKNKQEGQGWAALLQGGNRSGAPLSRPSEVYLVQGAIMQHGSEVFNPPRGFGPDEQTLVLELSSNAGKAMINEMNKLQNTRPATEGNWESMYENGDPIHLDFGRYVTFYKLADGDPRIQQQQPQAVGWNQTGSSRNNRQGREQGPIGYGCFLEPTFNGLTAQLREYEAAVAANVKPWENLLWFPTEVEQAKIIAADFPADVICYAWRDHPEWIPDDTKRQYDAMLQLRQQPQHNQPGWGNVQGQGPNLNYPPTHQQPPLYAQPPAQAAPPLQFGGPSAPPSFGVQPPQQTPTYPGAGVTSPAYQQVPTQDNVPVYAPGPPGMYQPPVSPPATGFGAPLQVQQPPAPPQYQQPPTQAAGFGAPSTPLVGLGFMAQPNPAASAASGAPVDGQMPAGGVPQGYQPVPAPVSPQATPNAQGQTAQGFATPPGFAPLASQGTVDQSGQVVNQPPAPQVAASPQSRSALALAAAQVFGAQQG